MMKRSATLGGGYPARYAVVRVINRNAPDQPPNPKLVVLAPLGSGRPVDLPQRPGSRKTRSLAVHRLHCNTGLTYTPTRGRILFLLMVLFLDHLLLRRGGNDNNSSGAMFDFSRYAATT